MQRPFLAQHGTGAATGKAFGRSACGEASVTSRNVGPDDCAGGITCDAKPSKYQNLHE